MAQALAALLRCYAKPSGAEGCLAEKGRNFRHKVLMATIHKKEAKVTQCSTRVLSAGSCIENSPKSNTRSREPKDCLVACPPAAAPMTLSLLGAPGCCCLDPNSTSPNRKLGRDTQLSKLRSPGRSLSQSGLGLGDSASSTSRVVDSQVFNHPTNFRVTRSEKLAKSPDRLDIETGEGRFLKVQEKLTRGEKILEQGEQTESFARCDLAWSTSAEMSSIQVSRTSAGPAS